LAIPADLKHNCRPTGGGHDEADSTFRRFVRDSDVSLVSLAHVVLPLAKTGIQEIPNEQPVLSAMQVSLGATRGLYFFPGMGLGPDATRQQENAAMQQYDQKLATNPSGLLIYHPPGAKALTPGHLSRSL
jgi:hypothetical protein